VVGGTFGLAGAYGPDVVFRVVARGDALGNREVLYSAREGVELVEIGINMESHRKPRSRSLLPQQIVSREGPGRVEVPIARRCQDNDEDGTKMGQRGWKW